MNYRKVFVCLLALSFLFSVSPVVAAGPQPLNEAFKAIAKINVYSTNSDYYLSNIGYGSGIIISDTGLLLTNNHVVEVKNSFDNSDEEAAYVVCLPENMVDEPDCSYSAKLIAKNSDLDIALLQIENIAGLGNKTTFPFLELTSSDTTNTNDSITAIGYPDIGNGTVTVTQGIVSGKTEKYGKKWIKTDAVTSFGSSGGAAINSSGKVIGITSAGHSDFLGSLGYIINIDSVNGWIAAHRTGAPQSTSLDARGGAFATKLKAIKSSNVFENQNPRFSITKPEGWEFDYMGEDNIAVYNPADEDAGSVNVLISYLPYQVENKDLINFIKKSAMLRSDMSLFKILEDKNVQVGNRTGKKITMRNSDGDQRFYMVSMGNYIFAIDYSYGLDDQDQNTIDGIIRSINFVSAIPMKEVRTYTNKDPYFSITVSGDWLIKQQDVKAQPLIIVNKKYKDLNVVVSVTKTDETTKKMNHEGLIKHTLELYETANRVGGALDIRFEMTEKTPHYKLNKSVPDIIRQVTLVKTYDKKRLVVYELGYTKKIGEKYLVGISMDTMNTDKKTIEIYKKEFDKMMQTLTFSVPQPKKDTDKDGLSDEDEKKYKTNPNKKDTDGDGFSDWVEVKNGYNPLGKGKLKK